MKQRSLFFPYCKTQSWDFGVRVSLVFLSGWGLALKFLSLTFPPPSCSVSLHAWLSSVSFCCSMLQAHLAFGEAAPPSFCPCNRHTSKAAAGALVTCRRRSLFWWVRPCSRVQLMHAVHMGFQPLPLSWPGILYSEQLVQPSTVALWAHVWGPRPGFNPQ